MAMKPRVLLIAPLFFNYYKDIKEGLEGLGYDVDFVCDTHSNSSLSKAVGRVSKRLVRGASGRYFRRKVRPLIEAYSYRCVLVVAGMTFSYSEKAVRELREKQTEARVVLYQWDAEKNISYVKAFHPYFDAVFSFDRFDCATLGHRFLPLFYPEAWADIAAAEPQYDCIYAGTAHPKKYREINELSRALGERMPRMLIHHYMPSRLKYWYHKLLSPEYRGAKFSDFECEKLSREALISKTAASRIVLDAAQSGQTGLTMRAMEALAAQKKLITTNPDIVNYDFYRPENIYVYDGAVDFDHLFFHSEYVPLPDEIYQKYSLKSWLSTLLGEAPR